MSDYYAHHIQPAHNRSRHATRRSTAAYFEPATVVGPPISAGIIVGVLSAVIAAAATWISGQGLLLALLAYAVAGSLMTAGSLTVLAARPLRPRLARVVSTIRRPATSLFAR